MDKLRFQDACEQVIDVAYERTSIGVYKEKTLHAVLKHYFEPHAENQEVKIGGYVADIVGEDGIIEIQTKSFDRLRKKLAAFLEVGRVTIVHPLAKTKWLRWIDPETGEVSARRKSPKQETLFDAAWELYRIRPLLSHPNLQLCFPLLELEELRYRNGWSKDGKKGSERCDRIPLALLDEIWFRQMEDYAIFLPDGLPEPFTLKEYAAFVHAPERRVRLALSVLCTMGLTVKCGQRGRAFLYERCREDSASFPSFPAKP